MGWRKIESYIYEVTRKRGFSYLVEIGATRLGRLRSLDLARRLRDDYVAKHGHPPKQRRPLGTGGIYRTLGGKWDVHYGGRYLGRRDTREDGEAMLREYIGALPTKTWLSGLKHSVSRTLPRNVDLPIIAVERECKFCGEAFKPRVLSQINCGGTRCRMKAHRDKVRRQKASCLLLALILVAVGSGIARGDNAGGGTSATGGITSPAPLVDAPVIVVDASLQSVFEVLLGTGGGINRLLSCPINVPAGQDKVLTFNFTQDAIGGRIVVPAACYKTPGGLPFALTATANGLDSWTCLYRQTTADLMCPNQALNYLSVSEVWNGLRTSSFNLSPDQLTATATAAGSVYGNNTVSLGAYYFAVKITSPTMAGDDVGIAQSTSNNFLGFDNTSIGYAGDGRVIVNSATITNLAAYASGTNICVNFDLGNKKVWFQPIGTGKWDNNTTDNPSTNTGGINIASTVLSGSPAVGPGAYLNLANDIAVADFKTSCAGVSGLVGTVLP